MPRARERVDWLRVGIQMLCLSRLVQESSIGLGNGIQSRKAYGTCGCPGALRNRHIGSLTGRPVLTSAIRR